MYYSDKLAELIKYMLAFSASIMQLFGAFQA